MKYYVIRSGQWVRATSYNLTKMRQIELFDYDPSAHKMILIGIGLY